MLVWEPKRVVPSYAVPAGDIAGELGASPVPAVSPGDVRASQMAGRPVFDPSIPFSVHTTDGEPLTITSPHSGREAAAFRPADEALAGYVIVDFDDFDAWYEEDERNFGHARDPFHRIDIVHSSRHVRVERRRGARGVHDAVPPLRAAAPGPVLPARRGRADGPPPSADSRPRLGRCARRPRCPARR